MILYFEYPILFYSWSIETSNPLNAVRKNYTIEIHANKSKGSQFIE